MGVLIAIPGSLCSLIKLMAMFRRRTQSTSTKFTEIFIAVGFIGMLIFSGIGFYENQQLKIALMDLKSIASWGASGATVNTKVLFRYKNSHKAMLLFRLEVRSVNYLTDRDVIKSYFFEIDGKFQTIDVVLPGEFWSRAISSTGYVQAYLVIVPKEIASEQISCLADVIANRGRIISKRQSKAVLLLPVTGNEIPNIDQKMGDGR